MSITIKIDASSLTTIADDLIELIQEEAEAMISDIFVDLTASPPVGTPVDTGHARQAWQLDLSDPNAPEVYNNVPYIGVLNDGHSKQSPAGFVERAVEKNTRNK